MPARQLPHHHPALDQTDRLGSHDLVCALLLQQPVLMDAGGVGEGIGADDRLVRLDHHARDLADEATGLGNLLGADPRIRLVEILAAIVVRPVQLLQAIVEFVQAFLDPLAADGEAGEELAILLFQPGEDPLPADKTGGLAGDEGTEVVPVVTQGRILPDDIDR